MTVRLGIWLVTSALITVGISVPSKAETPTDRPFSMRGVELGISIDEFRKFDIPDDNGERENLQTRCSTDAYLLDITIFGDSKDQADGVVECQWFSKMRSFNSDLLLSHWINIGTGSGNPLFRFIKSNGELRLFSITFYANSQYYAGILDALSRGYGDPLDTVEPFKTLSGSDFTSTTSVWDNGMSTITLVERCRHLERYCLTYEHRELVKPYLEIQERRAAAAATKI